MDTAKKILRANIIASILLIAGICLLVLSCDDSNDSNGDEIDNQDFTASQDFSYAFSAGSRTVLVFEGITGSVNITGIEDSDSVQVHGERRVKSDSQTDAEEHLSDLIIDITETNEEIIVRTEQPDNTGGRGYEVDYFIDIPPDWEVIVDHITGNVSVENIEADSDIDNITGNISLTNCAGDIRADLTTGNMAITDVVANIDADLTTGNINCSMVLPEAGNCVLELVTGSIFLSIPQTTSAVFAAGVTTGSIAISNLVLNNADISDTHASGILGGGNGNIELEVITGNINVQGF